MHPVEKKIYEFEERRAGMGADIKKVDYDDNEANFLMGKWMGSYKAWRRRLLLGSQRRERT